MRRTPKGRSQRAEEVIWAVIIISFAVTAIGALSFMRFTNWGGMPWSR